jgi:pSer/pThr/pTyr-binding forkhead associated (FHA) protein
MKRYTIGRERDNDIVITDPSVSRRHAELVDSGGGSYRLVDLASSNGTWSMGDDGWARVTTAELDADALVRIGDHFTSVTALLTAAGAPPPPSRAPRDEDTKAGR